MKNKETWDKFKEEIPKLKKLIQENIEEYVSTDELERHSIWYRLYSALVDFELTEF